LRKKFRTNSSKLTLNKNEGAVEDLEAVQRERERLLQALKRIRDKKQRLQKETNRLFAKAKSLDCTLIRSQQNSEYLERDE